MGRSNIERGVVQERKSVLSQHSLNQKKLKSSREGTERVFGPSKLARKRQKEMGREEAKLERIKACAISLWQRGETVEVEIRYLGERGISIRDILACANYKQLNLM